MRAMDEGVQSFVKVAHETGLVAVVAHDEVPQPLRKCQADQDRRPHYIRGMGGVEGRTCREDPRYS